MKRRGGIFAAASGGILLVSIGWGGANAEAGPWTKSAGEIYVKLSESAFFSGAFADARTGDRTTSALVPGTIHKSITTAIYVEVGLYERLHLQLYAPHVVGLNAFEGGSRYLSLGAGDLSAGLQWSSSQLAFPHAVRAEVKVPMYDAADPTGFERPRFPARGDGQIDSTLWVSLGHSLASAPIYLFAEIGHRFRTERYVGQGDILAFRDSFVFSGQVGVTVILDLVVAANLNGVVPYGSDEVTKGYTNVGVALFLPLASGFALEANFDGTTWVKNSSRGLSLGFGVSYHL